MGMARNEIPLLMLLIKVISEQFNNIPPDTNDIFFARQMVSTVMLFSINDIINDIERLCHKPDGLLVTWATGLVQHIVSSGSAKLWDLVASQRTHNK